MCVDQESRKWGLRRERDLRECGDGESHGIHVIRRQKWEPAGAKGDDPLKWESKTREAV